MVMYILKLSSTKSTTWSHHIELLCLQYGLPPPLLLLTEPAWSKNAWNDLVKTKVTIYHERKQRDLALANTKMMYLNVKVLGLSGCPHPAIQNIFTTQDVKKLRLHVKFLTCDYLTNERLALNHPGKDPGCQLCPEAPTDSIEHVIMSCRATSDVRDRLLPELLNAVALVQPNSKLLEVLPPPSVMTQFVLDCTSFNLPDTVRIPYHNPQISEIFRISRDWCFALNNERCRLLQNVITAN